MSLFKNANESAYVGGRKHFTDVLKNSGPGDLLVWRQPEEDFNNNSTLIVMPGENAVFVKGGQIEAVFAEGTYKLNTENYPFLSRLRNALSGGISAFNAVVFFVRVTTSREQYWGTASPIKVRDKVWGFFTEMRVRGAYKVRIEDPARFLQNLMGNNIRFEEEDALDDYFRETFQSKIRTAVTARIKSLDTELIGLDEHLDQLSEDVRPAVEEILQQYGMHCESFAVSACDVDDEKYQARDEAQVEFLRAQLQAKSRAVEGQGEGAYQANVAAGAAQARMYEGQGERAYMDNLGDKWAQHETAAIMGSMAENPGTGGEFASMGVGLGFGAQMMHSFSDLGGNLADGTLVGGQQQVTGQHAAGQQGAANRASAPQQPASQAAPTPQADDPFETLSKLKRLLDAGLIEQSEYNAKKTEILGRM